jgi:HEAT repeat protein
MAAAALGTVRPTSTKVVEPLLRLSKDENASVRRAAVKALGRMEAPPSMVIDRLIELTSDDEALVRWSAAEDLLGLDDTILDVTEAISAAIPASEVSRVVSELDPSESFTIASLCIKRKELEALGQSLLAAILNDASTTRQSRYQRVQAADLLGGVAELEDATVEALFRGLLDSLSNVREASARALAQLGRRFPSKGIEIRLLKAIDDPLYGGGDGSSSRSGQDYAFEGLSMLTAKQTSAGL